MILKVETDMFAVPFVTVTVGVVTLNCIGRNGKLCPTLHRALEKGPLAVTQLVVLELSGLTVTDPAAPHGIICPKISGLTHVKVCAIALEGSVAIRAVTDNFTKKSLVNELLIESYYTHFLDIFKIKSHLRE